MKKFVLIVMMIGSIAHAAKKPKVPKHKAVSGPSSHELSCQNMYEAACVQTEDYEWDGTYVSETSALQKRLSAEIGSEFSKKVEHLIRADVNFRESYLAATTASAPVSCAQRVPSPTSVCLTELVRLAKKELWYGAHPFAFNDYDPAKDSTLNTLEKNHRILVLNVNHQLQDASIQKFREKLRIADREAAAKATFDKLKELVKARIVRMELKPFEKEALLAKVEGVKFETKVCSASLGALTEENAFFHGRHGGGDIHFCGGFLAENSSEFSTALILAHEIGHAIDGNFITPSFGNQAYETIYPGLAKCLMSGGAALATPTQLNDAFADWMAMEVLPEYISWYSKNKKLLSEEQTRAGYRNAMRNFCGTVDHAHPKSGNRMRLIEAHPDVRNQMNCNPYGESTSTYCTIKDETPREIKTDPLAPLPAAKGQK